MNLAKNLHWFVYIIFLTSCARQSSPTGGPKDTIPPVLTRAIPRDETINFNENEIQLIFSENVILNSPKEQLIVTPTIGKDYKIVYRKNTVTLTFEDPLQDSTTYTFNFRDAIQDITEKNPVRNLQIAYSTGNYIDSLSIEGIVFNLLRGTELKNVTVALHSENDTFNIFEHSAVYFTKTDTKGNFKISHLKPGNYFLYAFDDKNRNLIVNSRTEAYGFTSEYHHLQDTTPFVPLGLVRLDAGPLKITSARPYNTYFNMRTTKPLRTFHITDVADSSDLSFTFGEDQANIRLYKTTTRDSLQIHLLALDSLDNAIDTTLYAKYLSREVTPEPFRLAMESSSLLGHKGLFEATLQFTKPLKELNLDSIFFQLDSLTRVNFSREDMTWHRLNRKLTITKTLDPAFFKRPEAVGQAQARRRPAAPPPDSLETKTTPINELRLGAGAFISIENDSSARVVQSVKPVYADELAVINVEIRTEEDAFIVQLLDKNYKVLRELRNQKRVKFQDVPPGDYQIRLIIDRNQNGRWDPGNYFKLIEPEPVKYYRAPDGSTSVRGVKANWEVGTDGEMFITY